MGNKEQIIASFKKKHGDYTPHVEDITLVAAQWGISTEGKTNEQIQAEIDSAIEND